MIKKQVINNGENNKNQREIKKVQRYLLAREREIQEEKKGK